MFKKSKLLISLFLFIPIITVSMLSLSNKGSMSANLYTNSTSYQTRSNEIKTRSIDLLSFNSNFANELKKCTVNNISIGSLQSFLNEKATIDCLLYNPSSNVVITIINTQNKQLSEGILNVDVTITDSSINYNAKTILTISGFTPVLKSSSNIEGWQIFTIVISTISIFLIFILLFLIISKNRKRLNSIWDDAYDKELFDQK